MKRSLKTAAAALALAFVANAASADAAAKYNRDTRADDRQIVVSGRGMPDIRPDTHAQLIAAAGLTTDAARGMKLTQVAAAKMNRESARD